MNPGRIYKEHAVHGSSATGLIITMYEMLIADLRRAALAMQDGDVEARTREVKHALEVILHLQNSIDFAHGGETANSLDAFYAIVRAKVLEAHIKQSAQTFQEQIQLIQTVCQGWREVEERGKPKSSELMQPPSRQDIDMSPASEWRA